MFVSGFSRDTAAGGAGEKTDLKEKRLVDIFDRFHFLGSGGGDSCDPDRSAVEFFDNGPENLPVRRLETQLVNFEVLKSSPAQFFRYCITIVHLREIPNALQEPVGDSRGATAGLGNSLRAGAVDWRRKDFGGATYYIFNLFVFIEIQDD